MIFERYLGKLFKTINERSCRVLVGIADNVMPEADMGRVEKVARRVEGFA